MTDNKINKMTPLEKAEIRQKLSHECPPCSECPNAKLIDNVLYCKTDGKIIMPRFYNVCCCRGERLQRNVMPDDRRT